MTRTVLQHCEKVSESINVVKMLSLISVQALENINLVVGVAVLGAALAYYVEDGHKLGNQHLFKLLGLKIMLKRRKLLRPKIY